MVSEPTEPSKATGPSVPIDDVILKRRRIAHWVGLAKRVGYLLLLLAILTFVVAAITGFEGWLVTVTVVALIAACIILPVPIVLGYGLRAADREDREAAARQAAGGTPPATGQ